MELTTDLQELDRAIGGRGLRKSHGRPLRRPRGTGGAGSPTRSRRFRSPAAFELDSGKLGELGLSAKHPTSFCRMVYCLGSGEDWLLPEDKGA